MGSSFSEDVIHGLARILRQLLVEVRLYEQASSKGGDDITVDDGHLLIEALNIILHGARSPPRGSGTSRRMSTSWAKEETESLDKLVYQRKVVSLRLEPNPLHMQASRDFYGTATMNKCCLEASTWSIGSEVSSYGNISRKVIFWWSSASAVNSVKRESV